MSTSMMTSSSMQVNGTKQADKTMTEWKTMFPEFATLNGSCSFIKKIIAVSVSAITYLRQIFPDEAYGEKNLCGIKLKILNEDSGLKSVTKFIDLIRSCYDAVEKRYLQQLCIGVCTDRNKRDEVVESYTLVFKYNDTGCSVTTNTESCTFSPQQGNPTVEATLIMLKSILSINQFAEKLPEKAYLSLKLMYYDDVTPEDYEPMGFESASSAEFQFANKPMKLSLGKIATNHHGYQLFFKTIKKVRLSPHDTEDPVLALSQTSNTSKYLRNEDQENYASSQESLSRNNVAEKRMDSLFQCPCGLQIGEESGTIKCLSCEKIQHKVCYGILTPEDIPLVFYCVECILYNTDGNSDLDLIYSHSEDQREDFCQLRRALAFSLSSSSVSVTMLEKYLGCSKSLANSLIVHLVSDGFLKKGPVRNKYTLDEDFINTYGMKDYFQSKDNKENEIANSDISVPENEDDSSLEMKNQNSLMSPLIETIQSDDISKSIYKVKTLSLKNVSPIQTRTSKRKRSLSSKMISPDNSIELFASQQKRRRTRKSK